MRRFLFIPQALFPAPKGMIAPFYLRAFAFAARAALEAGIVVPLLQVELPVQVPELIVQVPVPVLHPLMDSEHLAEAVPAAAANRTVPSSMV